MIYLIGSQALRYHAEEIPLARGYSDNEYDLICNPSDLDEIFTLLDIERKRESRNYPGKWMVHLKDGSVLDIDATGNQSNVELDACFDDIETEFTDDIILGKLVVSIPPENILYLIKRSHANFGVHFDKTMTDLLWMQENKWNEDPCLLYECERNFYNARHQEAKERFGRKQERINFNKTNKEFFRGGANLRKYEHDDIHKAVAFYEHFPMYLRCKWDWSSAKIDMDLFDRLHPTMQMQMVAEEAMTIGIERWYIPGQLKDPKTVYCMGLKKVTRDLCKGKFQNFIIDNWQHLWNIQLWNFIERFEQNLKAGNVREINN